MPIPVICDRCRARGAAGEAQFADFGDLLDFEPVPRRPRADGWTGELQRAFIAALAVTGSPRRAARAVGKAQFGADQLRKAKGAEGFNAAWDKAMAQAAEKGRHRLTAGFDAVLREDAQILPGTGRGTVAGTAMVEGPARGPGETDEDEELSPDEQKARLGLLAVIVRGHLLKLGQERRCRLEGRIAEADFYVRQLTCFEVALDLASEDSWKMLHEIRRGGHDLTQIAETDMSRLLDEARREHWQACGDPPRPGPTPRHLLVEHDGFSTEPLESTSGGIELSHEEQLRIFREQYARDAKAQIEWEAEARHDYERRRESDAAHNQEPGPAGQPAT